MEGSCHAARADAAGTVGITSTFDLPGAAARVGADYARTGQLWPTAKRRRLRSCACCQCHLRRDVRIPAHAEYSGRQRVYLLAIRESAELRGGGLVDHEGGCSQCGDSAESE